MIEKLCLSGGLGVCSSPIYDSMTRVKQKER